MYAYLNGKLTFTSPTEVYLDCNGVGYHVNITLNTYSHIEGHKEAKLYTYLHVREDAMILYGFSTPEEKEMFIHLISVSGVGPNTGRLILSSMTTNELQRAIIYEEVSLIESIKGIGPKSAKRLILELKDKLKSVHSGDIATIAGGTGSALLEEAVAALTMLGFARPKAEKVAGRILQSETVNGVEELIKLSLKNL